MLLHKDFVKIKVLEMTICKIIKFLKDNNNTITFKIYDKEDPLISTKDATIFNRYFHLQDPKSNINGTNTVL